MIEKYKKFWYHAGEFHDEGCPFILEDCGVCNCDTKKNKKSIESIEIKLKQDIYSI